MVSGRYKSRSSRRKQVKTKTGTKTRYESRNTSKPTCPKTGQVLNGVPRGKQNNIRKLGKSQKRPQRPFGGVLSSQAMRKKMKERARRMAK